MQIVDDIGMAVTGACGDMRMVGRKVVMTMRDLDGIVTWPERERGPEPDQTEHGEREHRRHAAAGALQPAGQRIGDEPAGMRQRELCGEQRRAVLGMS